jgi:hypothetical protein
MLLGRTATHSVMAEGVSGARREDDGISRARFWLTHNQCIGGIFSFQMNWKLMLVGTSSKVRFRVALLMTMCIFVASSRSIAAATAGVSVQVDPQFGDDSRCATTLLCRTIAFAVRIVGASQVYLSAGVYSESTVNISNAVSLVVSGVPSASFFDCSRRLGQTTGAAFKIMNSKVTITGVSFQNCSNINGDGGAVSAVDSSVTVSQCSFIGCSAANGGAVSASSAGRSSGLFLHIHNSNFSGNSAIGGIGCPTDTRSSEPCSTWGGAVAAFEMFNVSVTRCIMDENSAVAVAPKDSSQSNAVAGGGCLSVLFRGNSSTSAVHLIDNSFLRCKVDVSNTTLRKISVGNGSAHSCECVSLLW